jgi:hypothetical protein
MAGLWIAAVIITAVQATSHHNNNFEIFRASWENLLEGRDLYAPSEKHRDYFEYSPTFPLLFAPFAIGPYWLGVLLWNTANAGTLYWSLGRVLTPEQALAARAIVFLDTIGSMQNAQSNALSAGLIILVFAELQRGREGRAALAVSLGTAIKIFPAAAATFAILRPARLPRFALWSVLTGVALVLAPLVVLSPAELADQYRSWLAEHPNAPREYSVMGHLRLWLGVDWPFWPGQLIGVVILLAPLARAHVRTDPRLGLMFLASVLMFCVLFNHQAESPTFVIALAGVGIWFAVSARDRRAWALLAVVFVGTVLSASDAMPGVLQERFFEPYRLKTLPILMMWVVTQMELWRRTA